MAIYQSDQRLNTGEACQSMQDVRYEVDRLDRILVEILAERQTYMAAAARIKKDRSIVHDDARIADVLEKVLATSQEKGLEFSIAQPVWETLMRQSIAYELHMWDRQNEKGEA